MHLVLDGFEGRADNAVHKVQLLRGVLRHIQQLYLTVCLGSNPNLRIVANSQMDKALAF